MDAPIPERNTSDYFVYIFRRENYDIPELEKQKAQYQAGSPAHMAAVKLISEKTLEMETKRHSEVVGEAKGANRLSKWAIAIAIAALIVSVLASYLSSM
jgi:hypothetical protein